MPVGSLGSAAPLGRLPLLLLPLALLVGCKGPPTQADRVTAGMAESTLQSGTTTQLEVLEAFGAPNIVTRGSEGEESWTYERVAFDTYFRRGGLVAGGVGFGGSGGGGGIGSASGGQTRSGVRTVTLIIYFDGAEVVQDYRVMETHF